MNESGPHAGLSKSLTETVSSPMNDVTQVDFGKRRRDLERQIDHILGLAETMRADIERDPVRYYTLAIAEILAQRGFIEEIEAASWRMDTVSLAGGATTVEAPAKMEIDAEDYARCDRVLKLLARGPIRAVTPPSDKTA